MKIHSTNFSSYRQFLVLPLSEDKKMDLKYSSYLINHINNRIINGSIAFDNVSKDNQLLKVFIDVDNKLKCGYKIKTKKDELYLYAKDEKYMLWLIYQFISFLGEENKSIVVSDLPPAIIDFSDRSASFDFEYRCVYTPSNGDVELNQISGVNNIDYDWGLWGHNLNKIISSKNNNDIYALVDGERDKEQYCFSSEVLQRDIENYIVDNYGTGKQGDSIPFLIMPNDNDVVCMCDKCKSKGNKPNNATPAVLSLIERLAKKYPNYRFFTSSYLSAGESENLSLPSNTGVVVSAMELPVQLYPNKTKMKKFTNKISKWNKIVNRIYVWDYMRNFDDYFTPYPALLTLKERLSYYKSKGIKGVIFNGSGQDYASFDDIQTYVLNSLLEDINLDVYSLIKRYTKRFYPTTGDLILSYLWNLEINVKAKNISLPLYGGINDATVGYLGVDDFEKFFTELDKRSKKATDSERARLNKLLTSLSFTKAEIMRLPSYKYDKEEDLNILENLSGYNSFDDMKSFREAKGYLSDYIKIRENSDVCNSRGGNVLKDKNLRVNIYPGNKSLDLTSLTDRYYGIPIDYHANWEIIKADTIVVNLPSITSRGKYELKIGVIDAHRWHIYYPKYIEIKQKNRVIQKIVYQTKEEFSRNMQSIILKNLLSSRPITICIVMPDIKNVKLGIDEIELYKK